MALTILVVPDRHVGTLGKFDRQVTDLERLQTSRGHGLQPAVRTEPHGCHAQRIELRHAVPVGSRTTEAERQAAMTPSGCIPSVYNGSAVPVVSTT